jgi:branched-chain amino acid transport system substrate-binding protein
MTLSVRRDARRWCAGAAVLLFSAAMTTGCGGSDEGGGDRESTATGDPIPLSLIADISGSGGSFGETALMAQQAVERVNADGGVNGRPLALTVCDSKTDPNQQSTCSREAVDSDSVAMVGGYGVNYGNVIGVTDKAGVPWVMYSAATPEGLGGETAFNLNAGVPGIFSALGTAASDQCEEVAIAFSDDPSARGAVGFTNAGMAEGSGPDTGIDIPIPFGATDLSTQVAKIKDSGADCIVLMITPDQALALMNAMATAGLDIDVYGDSSNVTHATWEQLGGANGPAEGAYISQVFAPSDQAEWADFKKDIDLLSSDDQRKVDEGSSQAQGSWLSVMAIAGVLEEMGPDADITRESVLAALTSTSDLNSLMGDYGTLVRPIDFTTPWTENPAMPRLFTREVNLGRLEDGTVVGTGDAIDTSSALLTAVGG